jgi:hypothetical protein
VCASLWLHSVEAELLNQGLKNCFAAEVLARRKCGILNFTKAAQIEVGEVLLHYLAAAADSNEAVSRLGDVLLKKRCFAV